jgi:GT2 family glycosyltransferase/2-polyprenyl-3-methyl-5-hydroxy-6-metoxy-1,4-benzoquinol methylase
MQTVDNHTQKETNNLYTRPLVNKSESVIDEYYLHARPEILELVSLSALRVLDVGCGAGGFSAHLKNRQSVEVHGVELVTEAAEHARIHLDLVWNKTIEDALPDLPESYYDCIVAADVLEHLIDPWAVLKSLKCKLAPRGKIIVSIPNIQNWGVLSELIQGRWDYQSEGILDRTHLRFFTRKSIEELFMTAGLNIINLSTTKRGPLPPFTFLKKIANYGLSVRSLEQDSQTWQFLVEAEIPMQNEKPKVSVVILNWNGMKDTLECLSTVRQLDYPNYEIIIVDNGSNDGSVDAISKQYPDITLLQIATNLGYAGGNNVGISWALEHGADYVFVLNNDTIVDKYLLSHLVEAGFLDSQLGIIGPTNYYYNSPKKIWAIGAMITHTPQFNYKVIGDGDDGSKWGVHLQIDALVGSAMLIRRNVFESIGLFDERFFLCWEEFDFCERARNVGYKCLFVPEAKIWHKVGKSLGENSSPIRTYFNERNRLLWAKKHLSLLVRVNILKQNSIKLYQNVLSPKKLKDIDYSSPRRLFWSISSWVRIVKKNFENPINKATLIGLKDYCIGSYGNCPAQVRKLGK